MSEDLIPLPIIPPPGVVKTESVRSVEGRWIDTEKVRFVNGKPQKIGGWAKQTATPADGALRSLMAWRDNSGIEFIAGGTYKKLYVIERDYTLNNITPATTGSLANDPFAVTNASTLVTVTHTAHGRTVGSVVVFDGATAGGGITIDGEYPVNTVVDANTYTIVHSVAASSTDATTGGASVTYEYEITIGADAGAYGFGYGVGGYGEGTYGTERDASTIFIEPRIWSLDHFGEHLLASYNVGTLYFWDPNDTPLFQRATLVTDAPDDIRFMFVTPERFTIALCENMVIAWCTQGDYAEWTPASDNTAGLRTVTEGTKLIAGRSLSHTVSLLWSDSAVYLHQYNGQSLVFDTRVAGKNCGLIAPSAAITVGASAFWMGQNSFFQFNSGGVSPMPMVEDIRQFVFGALDSENRYLCCAMYNPQFNEIWFYYVASGALEPGLYAIYSLNTPSWSVGELTRVGGTHFQHGDTRPLWADENGDIFLHEEGYDDDGAAMDAQLVMAPAGLDKGKGSMEIEGMEPDFFEQDGQVTVTINTYDRIRTADDTPIDTDVHTVEETDGLLDVRAEGRYAGLTIRSNTLGGYFRMGAPVVYVKQSGTRR
jgi:hypothetical protein